MLETPAPCASWMAQPIADASNSGSDDDSDLDVPLRRVSPKSRCVADGSEPDSDPTPSEDLDADSDTNSDRTLRYEVETQIDSDLDSPPTPMEFRARKLPVFCAGLSRHLFKLMPQATNFSPGPADQRNDVTALCPFDIYQGATSF